MPQFPTPFSVVKPSKPLTDFVGCEAAEAFHAWASARLEVLDRSDPVAVNREILLLAVKYHEWYRQVPERHQTRVGKKGHQCIFHVFMHFMDLLTDARIRADPPVYFPAPLPPPPPAFADLGTLVGLAPDLDDTWVESEK